jgi:hypothetical protein
MGNTVEFETVSKTEKYKRIIENTIIECNRVLLAWSLSSKKVSYEDHNSLLRNFLVKFIKHEFKYRSVYNISTVNPLCVVKNNRIANISFANVDNTWTYNNELKSIGEYLKTFDFVAFDKTQRLNEIISRNEEPVISELWDINFDKIKQIKF